MLLEYSSNAQSAPCSTSCKHANSLPGQAGSPLAVGAAKSAPSLQCSAHSAAPHSAAYLIRLPAPAVLASPAPGLSHRVTSLSRVARLTGDMPNAIPVSHGSAPARLCLAFPCGDLSSCECRHSRACTAQLLVHPMWALRGRLLGAWQSRVGLPSYPWRPAEQRQTGSPRPHAPKHGSQAAALKMECAVRKVPT